MNRNIFIDKVIKNNKLDQLTEKRNGMEELSAYLSRGLNYVELKYIVENILKDLINFNNHMIYDRDINLDIKEIYIDNNKLYYSIHEKEESTDSFENLIKSILVETKYKEDLKLNNIFALINGINGDSEKKELIKILSEDITEKKTEEIGGNYYISKIISRFKDNKKTFDKA